MNIHIYLYCNGILIRHLNVLPADFKLFAVKLFKQLKTSNPVESADLLIADINQDNTPVVSSTNMRLEFTL